MDPKAKQIIRQAAPLVESALHTHLPVSGTDGAAALDEAVRYAVFSGGKRMRPVLALVAARMVGLDQGHALRIAAALEYLHTASLILDDLPCMDDTGERRGRVATHVRFGQGVAVLAAMALLNQTYALLATVPDGRRLVLLACDCIGHRGMVAGQAIDLAVDAGRRAGREDHYLKTTALFRLALLAPAMAAGAREPEVVALSGFGYCAGMGYQLVDDSHDLDDDKAWAGLEPQELRRRAADWIARAKAHLADGFGGSPEVDFLREFADWLLAGAQATEAKQAAEPC